MPKQVDHQERRREIAEAVYRVIEERGIEAVSLRDVAAEAGVSMGSVQHYFQSKNEMLLFALGYMRERVMARLTAALAKIEDPSHRTFVRTVSSLLLPLDKAGRQEAVVNVAFFSVATHTPEFAELLRQGYERLVMVSRENLAKAKAAGEIRRGIDTDQAAEALFFMIQGLIGPIVIGLYTPSEAMAKIDAELDSIFK